ncbi:MAG: hypothetical protein ACKPKO_18980, partial [Candidatus Fonsibacter sp.]
MVLNMQEVCPQDIRHMVLLASERKMWQRWAQSDAQWAKLPNGPWLQPVLKTIGRRPGGWSAQHAAAARAIVPKGHWAQAVRFNHGLSDTPLCQLCEVQDGTPRHRLDECHGHELWQLRKQCIGELLETLCHPQQARAVV